MQESEEKPLVVIRSLVYNHEPYLRDCLEGFVMQQTSFPFVAVVHDDCSTDNSAAIIREYAEKYPHIIKPVYETENQYSKKVGSLRRAMDEACGKYGAKYYALCEGDDYWTDPHKLQKQVDFLETHPDYTMVCCNGVIETPNEKLSTEEEYQKINWPYKNESGECTLEELLKYGGRYMLTAGLTYRDGIREKYPPECKNLPCGDYVLKIFAALTGKVYYLADQMVVYRFQSSATAWSVQKLGKKVVHLKDVAWAHDIHMLAAADRFSRNEHMALFRMTASQHARGLLHMYPHIADEIKDEMGYVLKYSYHAPYIARNRRSVLSKIGYRILRWMYHPYYPFVNTPCLLRPFWRRFYMVNGPKRTVHLGQLNLASFVSDAAGTRVYLFGRRVK